MTLVQDVTLSSDAVAPRPSGRRALQLSLLALPVLIFAWQAWAHRWTFEDGYINFRIVKQIEAGHGPVFNTGQRVEAYTSALWIGVLLIADVLLPLKLEWISVFLGVIGSAAGLALAIAGAASMARTRRPDAWLLPVGALVPIALYPMWFFATSGLEGGLSFAWIGGCMYILGRWSARPERRLGAASAVVLGLGWLIRPEFVLLTLALVVAVVVGQRAVATRRQQFALFGAVFALPFVYEIFRMGYFVALVPNTAFAKEAGGSRWSLGWSYLTSFMRTYALWLPAIVIVVALVASFVTRDRTQPRVWVTTIGFVAGGVLMGAYIVRVGGDYIPARLLLPAVFAICSPFAVLAFELWVLPCLLIVPWFVFAAFSYRPSGPYETAVGDSRAHVVTITDALRSPLGFLVKSLRAPGIYYGSQRIDAAPGPDASKHVVAEPAIGIIGYALGNKVDVFDTLGLADPLTARFELTHRGLPGHEKLIPPAWAAARLTAPGSNVTVTDFLSGQYLIRPMIPLPSSTQEFQRQVEEARQALGCGELRELHNAILRPLSIGGFFGNIVRSVRYYSLQIPPDPSRAVAKFCSS